jgi:hypothetical protein
MAHADTPPYLVPSDGAVVAKPWFMRAGDGVQPLPAVLPDWDYATVISIERVLEVDVDAIRQGTQSGSDAGFGLLVSAESSSTRVRKILSNTSLGAGGEMRLSLRIDPEATGGSLALETLIYVMDPDPTSPLSPSRAGAVLWKDVNRVRLEADAARLPVRITDFRAAGYPQNAPWLIEIDDSDLDVPASSAVHVYINSSHVLATAMAVRPDASELSTLLADVLELEMARRLLQVVVTNDDFDGESAYSSGSLGESLGYLMAVHFPNQSAASLKASQQLEPWTLDSHLASSLEVFSG